MVEYDRDGLWTGAFKTIAPKPGMTSDEFTDLLDSLDDTVFAGAFYDGAKVRAENVQDNGVLHSYGTGRYLVSIEGQPLRDKSGNPFVLDLGELVQ